MAIPFDAPLSRRQFVSAATAGGLALAGLSFAGAVPAGQAQASEAGTTFIYGLAGDPGSTVNPITTSDRYGLTTLQTAYSHLLNVNADGSVSYFLATDYEVSDDFLTYTVHLRDDVKWHDGEPFTADDVVFTFEAIEGDPTANGYSNLNFGDDGVVKVEKIDDYTVAFTFPFLNPAALESLGGETFIAAKHVYGDVSDWENNDVNTKAVGTGPYVLEEYVPGQYLKFRANEDYFLGAPNIETVIYQVILSEASGQTAIQAGEINALVVTPAQAEQLDLEGNNLQVNAYSEGRVNYLNFNAERVPDERVRKAFFYALDKKAIADAALLSEDYYQVTNTFLPPNSGFYSDDVEHYDRDVEKAKELLAEAGQPNPKLTLVYSGTNSIVGLMVQEQAAEAGFSVELLGLDSTAFINAIDNPANEYDIYLNGYIMGTDPSTYSALFTSDADWNWFRYDPEQYPQIDELFKQGLLETDDAARHEIYADVQAAIADAAIQYPLYTDLRLLVTTGNVSGIEDAKLVPVYTFEDLSKLKID